MGKHPFWSETGLGCTPLPKTLGIIPLPLDPPCVRVSKTCIRPSDSYSQLLTLFQSVVLRDWWKRAGRGWGQSGG